MGRVIETRVNNVLVRAYDDHEDASRAMAQEIADMFASGGSLNLSGGGTILRTEELLTTNPHYRDRINWARTHLFWGDEHWRLPGDPNTTNFYGAWQYLKALVEAGKLPRKNVHDFHLPQSEKDLLNLEMMEEEARRYRQEMIEAIGLDDRDELRIRLSIIGLGGGKPGDPGYAHFASILSEQEGCPDYVWNDEKIKLVVPVIYPPGAPKDRARLTFVADMFTYIYSDRTIMFVTGESKAQALYDVLTCDISKVRKLPGAIIQRGGSGEIITDKACAKLVLSAKGIKV